MNICLLASGFLPKVGGLEIAVYNLATAFHQLGHRVVVVAPKSPGRGSKTSCPFRVVNFGFRGSSRFKITSLLAVGTLYHVVKRFDIDIIHVHDVFAPGTWARYFKRLKPTIPIVGTPHGEDINVVPSLNYGRRLDQKADAIIRRNIAGFDMLTAISQSVHVELAAILKDERRIRDIPNGIWTNQFKGQVNRTDVRKKYGIPNDAIALLSVGRNVPVKGFEYGLHVVAKVIKTGFRLAYVLVGRDMSPIKSKARDQGISDCVFTPGELSQDQVIELYKAADIYLNTSRIESFGLTTLEAMCSGLACIVTDVPGNRDVVSREYGALVTDFLEEELEGAIRHLANNASRRKEFGRKAQRAAMDYDWQKTAVKYVNVYLETIKNCKSNN